MKIGTEYYPDHCPKCNSKSLARKPIGKERPDGNKVYLIFQVVCLYCDYAYPPVKIEYDTWLKEQHEDSIKDVTPKKRRFLFG